jgi:nucleoside-diphosphate-sugar epimerase/predicted dehydrogenase
LEHTVFRVGFVGAGFIADYHAMAIRSVPDAKVVAVCDTRRASAEALARSHAIDNVYDSLSKMLHDSSLDVVHVLVPPDGHFAAAKQALEAGAHVLIEKPMCTDPDDCSALVELAGRCGRQIGVGHNSLFFSAYERLRCDVREGRIGPIDHVTIEWSSELPPLQTGPFDLWMLQKPANMLFETGAHPIAIVLDLIGTPECLAARAGNPVRLPNGQCLFRRWQIQAWRQSSAVDLHLSFVRGLPERRIHVRGQLGSATADCQHNTYILDRASRYAEDFGRYHRLKGAARSLRTQARRNLGLYVLSKCHLSSEGNAWAASIARSTRAFYAGLAGEPDPRTSGSFAAKVVQVCQQAADAAAIPESPPAVLRRPIPPDVQPDILVIGGTGFIGRELVRQLLNSGRPVRMMARRPAGTPFGADTPNLEICGGSILDEADILRAMRGVRYVFHLAHIPAKTLQEYRDGDLRATRTIARCCLRQGVARLVYTGTISSYYTGAKAGIITEQTPLDPRIERRDNYAYAKAMAEHELMEMHHKEHLPVVIFRPAIVVGRGGNLTHWGVGMWNGLGLCKLWGDGRNKLPFVLVEDVARALIAGMDSPDIEGESFNLAAEPCLTAMDYVEQLQRAVDVRVQVIPTPIWRFYAADMFKWLVKCLVRHPERRRPSYRDWESRTAAAVFDCRKAKRLLGWRPTEDRESLIEQGVRIPAQLAFERPVPSTASPEPAQEMVAG